MHNQRIAGQFNQHCRVKRACNRGQVWQQQCFQVRVGNVACGNQQQTPWLAVERETDNEISVFSHHDPPFSVGDLDNS